MTKFQLGDWLIDPQGGTFQQGEQIVRAEPKVMDVLLRLAEADGQVVTREALLESVWGNVVVSEEALTRCVSELRTLLGDTGRQRRYIRTVPKRGYAIMMTVEWIEGPLSQKETNPSSVALDPGAQPQQNYDKRHDHKWLFASMVAAAIAAFFIYLTFANQSAGPTPINPPEDIPLTDQQVEAADTLARLVINDERPSLAVLPFSYLSTASEYRYAAEALTEDLRNDLTQTNSLRVAARTSSLAFRGQAMDIREIGNLLNVEHLVEGSVRLTGSDLRITVQLTDANSGYQVWSQVYERPPEDMRGLDVEIAELLMAQIVPPEISGGITKNDKVHNPEAHSQYLLARYYSSQDSPEAKEKAIEHYLQTIEIDEGFGRAYGGLAQLYMDRATVETKHGRYMIDPEMREQIIAQVEPLLSKAVSLEPSSGEVLAASARYANLQGSIDEAINTYQLALDANPSMPMARLSLGELLLKKEEVNLAFEQYSIALQTDPLHPSIQRGFVWGLMAKGEYVEAIQYAGQFFEQSKDERLLQIAMRSYVLTGQYDKALMFAQSYNFSPQLERMTTFHVIDSLYQLRRFEDADKLRKESEYIFDEYSQANMEVNRGVSLRDPDIVYRAADMLEKTKFDFVFEGTGEDCTKPYSDYWRAYGAYIERDYSAAIEYFEDSEEGGFHDCLESPDLEVSFSLYYSHTLQLAGDERAASRLSEAKAQLTEYSDRGWGGSRLGLYNIALNLLSGNFGVANDELIRLREQDIEPFGMIFAEPIFDDFYGNALIEPTMKLVRMDFEETRKRCEDQQLVKFGL